MSESTKVNLTVWLPVIMSILALVGVAMALGSKNAKLDALAESVKDVAPLRIEVEVLKSNYWEIKSQMKQINDKQDKILEEIRRP